MTKKKIKTRLSKKVDLPKEIVRLPYKAILNSLGKNYEALGATVSEALNNIKPGIIKGRAILTVSHDGKSRQRVLMPRIAIRLFNTFGMVHEIFLKNTSLLFSDL